MKKENFENISTYASIDRLKLVRGYSAQKALAILKTLFAKQLEEALNNDKKYCLENKLDTTHIDFTRKQTLNLLDQLTDMFEVEALANFVFVENVIPTIEQVKLRASVLRRLYPGLDIWNYRVS